jgi:SAM-dependent methyltransferase
MRVAHLAVLVCPGCRHALTLEPPTPASDVVREGSLSCSRCNHSYPIIGGIPRFVATANYASSFGYQWLRHARTQYDSESGRPISEQRFFQATTWPRRLEGESILEVGSGSGRFTEQALGTGAFVASVDYSRAVEANYASNGDAPNVLIVQADVFALPFAPATFDRVFCFGVLQHTPDPERAFLALPPMLKPGGRVAIDVYRKGLINSILNMKYPVRRLVRGIPPERLYAAVDAWIRMVWPLARLIGRLPLGPPILHRLVVPYYPHLAADDQRRIWATLDAFDMLSPRYDLPQRHADVRRWFARGGLQRVEVADGPNGIVGRGVR